MAGNSRNWCRLLYEASYFPNILMLRQRRGKKKSKLLTTSGLDFLLVGITGLEPATSRPPDVCATNCAKSRSFQVTSFEIGCKGTALFRYLQIFNGLFFYIRVFYFNFASNNIKH